MKEFISNNDQHRAESGCYSWWTRKWRSRTLLWAHLLSMLRILSSGSKRLESPIRYQERCWPRCSFRASNLTFLGGNFISYLRLSEEHYLWIEIRISRLSRIIGHFREDEEVRGKEIDYRQWPVRGAKKDRGSRWLPSRVRLVNPWILRWCWVFRVPQERA
jgi:hypothetical protein